MFVNLKEIVVYFTLAMGKCLLLNVFVNLMLFQIWLCSLAQRFLQASLVLLLCRFCSFYHGFYTPS